MLHTLQTKQFIKSDIQTVWDFMSSPENLEKITPTYMGFKILSDLNKMFTKHRFAKSTKLTR